MLEIGEDLVAVGIEASDAEAVIRLLADRLCRCGAVDASYGDAAIRRERDHPTGLPSRPICIAFPHADAGGVARSALAVATLRRPVQFKNMGDPDEELPVELVFMLANNSPEEQVEALRRLALVFSSPEKLVALQSLCSPAEIARMLRQELLGMG